MKTLKKPDPILLAASLILVLLGVLILASVSAVFSMEKTGQPNYLLNHQLLYGLLPGLILGSIAFFFPLEKLKNISFWLFILNLFSLGLLASSRVGLNLMGASRWISLGPITFQPSEFLKISLILYLAAWLTKQEVASKANGKRRFLAKFSPLLPFLPILGVIAFLLALQPDIGTLSIVASTALAVFFLSGAPWWQNISLWLLGAAALAFLIKIAPYRFDRWLVFLNPDLDPMGRGYQLKQSLIAIGSGGFLGLGLSLSRQKFGFLPQAIGDAIFPVWAEEAGFLGAAILVLIFLIFIWQGFRVSRLSKDKFSQLIGAGISFWIGFQALANIGSMMGLLPLTGVPLPFVSYGGSHLAAELIGVGLLLNISKTNR